MKSIRSNADLLNKLKKHTLLFGVDRYYLSDFHKTPVAKSTAEKFISEGFVEKAVALKSWFETEWKLKNEFRKEMPTRKLTPAEAMKILKGQPLK